MDENQSVFDENQLIFPVVSFSHKNDKWRSNAVCCNSCSFEAVVPVVSFSKLQPKNGVPMRVAVVSVVSVAFFKVHEKLLLN